MIYENIIQELITQSRKEDVREILIHPLNGVFFRKGHSWHCEQDLRFTQEMMIDICHSMNLTIEEPEATVYFHKEGVHANLIRMDEGSFIILNIRWIDERYISKNAWEFPEYIYKALQKKSSVSILYGIQQSGKSTVLRLLMQELLHDKKLGIFVHDYPSSGEIPFKKNIIDFSIHQFLKIKKFPISADYLFIDSIHPLVLGKAMGMARSGSRVILTKISTNLRDITNSIKNLDFISLCIHLKLITGKSSILAPAFQVTLFNEDIKRLIMKQEWDKLEYELQENSTKYPGSCTMNQSILQLLLKRKIDWNVGFEESSNPEDLDKLLKHLGI